MPPTDDTLPPDEPNTLDDLPLPEPFNDTEPPPPFIPAGFAVHAFMAACSDLALAFQLVEATGMALARALDAQSETEGQS